MSKSRAKGNRAVREAMETLEADGFLVSKAELGGKFTKQKDLFGLFDLVAIDPDEGIVFFIQITCNRPHTHKKYEEWVKQFKHPTFYVHQWVKYDYKGWKRFIYTKRKRIVIDLRK